MPDERLTADELLAVCWDDPGVVLGDPGGVGRGGRGGAPGRRPWPWPSSSWWWCDPAAQRPGLGRRLLAAAESWAWDEGAGELHLAGSAPFYLWPGVDVSFTAMHCLVESGRLPPRPVRCST